MNARVLSIIVSVGLISTFVLALAGPAQSHYSLANARSCGHLSFTPGTDLGSSHYGAGQIRARRTTCATAKRLARKSKDAGGKTFSASGFRCGAKRHAGHVDYRCTRGRATVVFATVGTV